MRRARPPSRAGTRQTAPPPSPRDAATNAEDKATGSLQAEGARSASSSSTEEIEGPATSLSISGHPPAPGTLGASLNPIQALALPPSLMACKNGTPCLQVCTLGAAPSRAVALFLVLDLG